MSKTISVTVRYLDVDVELSDIDTYDLREELESRDAIEPPAAIPPLNGEETHPLHEIYYAFKFGLTDRAADLSRAYVCDQLGVVL